MTESQRRVRLIFGALLLGTALTVVAAYIDLGILNPVVALGIAAWSAWKGRQAWRGDDCC